MKRFLLFLVALMFLLPISVFAKKYYDDYNTLNLREALAQEKIELLNKDYKEDSKQTIIYLFRGNGCGFCRNFLSFLSSISNEYGKYFRLVSFEVWGDNQNSSLMNKVSSYTGVSSTGIPYIIIGDKVFTGYNSDYDEDIKKAIMDQYDKNDADIFEKITKAEKGNNVSTFAILFWNFVFIALATWINIYISGKNRDAILEAIKNTNVPLKEGKKGGRKKRNEE